MRGSIRAAVAFSLVVAPGLFAAAKIPEEIVRARYVALGYDTGDAFVSEVEAIAHPDKVLREDQTALRAVRDQLETWDKYVITVRPEQAEILVVVRAGRRGVVSMGAPLGARPAGGSAGGPAGASAPRVTGYGGQLSSQGDMLTIYESRQGRPGTLLWRQQHTAGFPSRLFEQFKADVERSPKKPKP
jgi:hypothetical protein